MLAAESIAREAGRLLRETARTQLVVQRKGSAYDFVTNADHASQALIQARLRERFAQHHFVGEEDDRSDADVARMLSRMGEDEYCWIVDPLDGTTNYIHNLQGYAVSMALYHAGEVIAGAIYLPVEDEMFLAARGEGAFLNGVKLRVSSTEALSDALTTTGIPPVDPIWRAQNIDALARVGMRTFNTRIMGCATRCIAYVAAGRFDAYWEIGPHPWDVAAGLLMVREAGGSIVNLRAERYVFGDPRFMASNGRIEGALLEALAWPADAR